MYCKNQTLKLSSLTIHTRAIACKLKMTFYRFNIRAKGTASLLILIAIISVTLIAYSVNIRHHSPLIPLGIIYLLIAFIIIIDFGRVIIENDAVKLTTLFKNKSIEISEIKEYGVYQLGWFDGFGLKRAKTLFYTDKKTKGLTKMYFVYISTDKDFKPNDRFNYQNIIAFQYNKEAYELLEEKIKSTPNSGIK